MSKSIVIISTSLRPNSNSDLLADAFRRGAEAAGNRVEYISLRQKKIGFCVGCMKCASAGECVIKDDAVEIERKVVAADVVVWATPVYYHMMSGQMKTLMDRLNPMYPKDYAFRDVYLLATAEVKDESMCAHTADGVREWADNLKGVRFAGYVYCGGVDAPGEIRGNAKLEEAFELGRNC